MLCKLSFGSPRRPANLRESLLLSLPAVSHPVLTLGVFSTILHPGCYSCGVLSHPYSAQSYWSWLLLSQVLAQISPAVTHLPLIFPMAVATALIAPLLPSSHHGHRAGTHLTLPRYPGDSCQQDERSNAAIPAPRGNPMLRNRSLHCLMEKGSTQSPLKPSASGWDMGS